MQTAAAPVFVAGSLVATHDRNVYHLFYANVAGPYPTSRYAHAPAGGRRHEARVDERACFSVQSIWQGRAFYQIETGRFIVDDRTLLILNHSQPYEIEINEPTTVTMELGVKT